jgi:hypothetical protein
MVKPDAQIQQDVLAELRWDNRVDETDAESSRYGRRGRAPHRPVRLSDRDNQD